MFRIDSLLESFVVVAEDPSLEKRFRRIERTHESSFGNFRIRMTYVPWVLVLWPESHCVVCGRPAHHVCVIEVKDIVCVSLATQSERMLDLRTREAKIVRTHLEEELLHHQPLCLFGDCARPPRVVLQNPA